MKIFKINLAFTLCALSITSAVVYWHATRPDTVKPLMANEQFILSDAEVHQLSNMALNGDSHAAIRLAKFHDMITSDRLSALKWWELAAKLGDVDAQYSLAVHLLATDSDADLRRGCELMTLASRRGSRIAQSYLQLDKNECAALQHAK